MSTLASPAGTPVTDLSPIALKYLSEKVQAFERVGDIIKEYNVQNNSGNPREWSRLAFLVQFAAIIVKEVNEDIIKEFCERINHAAETGLIEKFYLMGVFSMKLSSFDSLPEGAKLISFYAHSRHTEEYVVKSMPDLFVYEGELRNYYGFDPRDLIKP